MINRINVNKMVDKQLPGATISTSELMHLIEHHYVISHSHSFVCVTHKLWSELLQNEDNVKLIKSLRNKEGDL